MVLENPTKAEKKRFEELQSQGFLPSEALKKIETERRLGIIPEEKPSLLSITKENWWFYAAVGTLFAGYLYFRFKPPTTQTVSLNKKYIEYLNNNDYVEYEIIEL